MSAKKKPVSQKASALSARLMAVQAVYQSMLNEQRMTDAGREYLNHRTGMEVDGEEIVEPDKKLVTSILRGMEERSDDLMSVLSHHFSEKKREPELLIKSILLCGLYEILAHVDIDVPIIINDYLNVSHGFFDQGEVNLINGILDKAASSLRDQEAL